MSALGCLAVGGDPMQLGPVIRNRETTPPPPVYMCRTFRDSFLSRYGSLVFLLGSHRQSSGGWFAQCLDRIRMGTVTDTDLLVLNATSDGITDQEWAARTQLRALNADVNCFNSSKLAALPGAETVYRCRDTRNPHITHPKRVAFIDQQLQLAAPAAATFKPGAIVLLTREVSGVPTATQGTVKRCDAEDVECSFRGTIVRVPYVSFDLIDNCGTLLGSRQAVPLTLAWAMTIHRAQGANLETLAADFASLSWREPGLVYTGLSRCRLFENLFVRGLRRNHIVVSTDAAQFFGP